MDISNKTLAMFLVAAIVVSIAGTTISLNRLGTMDVKGPTGFATSGVGNVTLSVGTTLSIILDDALIDFDTCVPEGGADVNISSMIANGSASINCIGPGVGGDQIDIRNDGNTVANLTMNSSNYGAGSTGSGTFLQVAGNNISRVWVNIINESGSGHSGGCLLGLASAWTELDSSNFQNLTLCERLGADSSDNSIAIDINITLPQGATTGDFIEFDIWATASS